MTRSVTQPAASVDTGIAVSDFHALYREHFAFVWRCLGALGVAPSGLDDAVQEVFVVVHRRMREFRGESSVRTWLYGIVRNVAANARRAQRRKSRYLELRDEELPVQTDALSSLETREAARFVQLFVHGLNDKKRDFFVLAIVEQLTIPEVAAILGVPLNTAYTRLRALRNEFRCALERHRAES